MVKVSLLAIDTVDLAAAGLFTGLALSNVARKLLKHDISYRWVSRFKAIHPDSRLLACRVVLIDACHNPSGDTCRQSGQHFLYLKVPFSYLFVVVVA